VLTLRLFACREVTVSGLIEKVERLSSADKLELYLILKGMVGR
jgi:hypothetical protein